MIDNNLTWKTHIQQIKLKIAKSIGVLSRLRHIVSKDILVSIYNAFIQPHINYSIINWGGTYTSILEPLRKAMKHAVRLFKNVRKNNFATFFCLRNASIILKPDKQL